MLHYKRYLKNKVIHKDQTQNTKVHQANEENEKRGVMMVSDAGVFMQKIKWQ